MTPREVVAFAQENNCQMVDYKFLDFVGIWQHFSVPMSEFGEDTFEEGIGFDGSSIRGWQPIHNSDMLLIPDPTTAKIDPFIQVTTLSLICDIIDPITREGYTRDPRFIAKKAEAYLKSSGIGDAAYFGPEAEFFLFDDVRYSVTPGKVSYQIDAEAAAWNTDTPMEMGNLAHRADHKGGYFPVPCC